MAVIVWVDGSKIHAWSVGSIRLNFPVFILFYEFSSLLN